ncbi:MAG: PilZ domain-containing protein [Chromatiales bacterium]|nr:PilZ domain-containing protein [Chromatiales bacterium]
MEHRCGVRHNLEVTVLVRRRGWAGSVVARLTDLSISGAFIEGPPGAFPLYSLVLLEATPPGGASTRLMSCKAMVARVSDKGVGLVFDQIRPSGLAPLFGPATGPATGPACPAVRLNERPALR